jgi:hypothetical protein
LTLSIDILYYAITKLCWAYQKEAWFLQSRGKIKIITDEPTLEDALDFDRYSQELADIIMNSTPRFYHNEFYG